MKQFLVILAVLPILVVIMVEFSLNTIINLKIDAVDDTVYTYKEIAKQDGTFANVVEDMKASIAAIVQVDSDDIKVDGTYCDSNPIYRVTSMSAVSADSIGENFLHYKVKVPIKEMKILGNILKFNTNKYYYTIDSYTASEKLP